ncbi:MAG: hypothetical protein IPI15_14205 [Saprospiraceae bacterium]|uniref:hypothetical protein n=1 Tax=Candidatus Brachybacter algidus TaxID=2982024 RepID=UPI00257A6A64|nr:hypothetical protein [Candidatus Brachybacter algidus]MBK7604708.1 hypothetical protein [Candidatus Brachybacter algidus]
MVIVKQLERSMAHNGIEQNECEIGEVKRLSNCDEERNFYVELNFDYAASPTLSKYRVMV